MSFSELILALAMVIVAALGIGFVLVSSALVASVLRHPFRRDDAHVARRATRRALADRERNGRDTGT